MLIVPGELAYLAGYRSLLSFRDCRIDCASSRDMILSLCLGYGVPFGGRSRLKPRRSLRSLLSLQQVARLLFEAASVTIEGLAEPSLVRAPVRPRQYQPAAARRKMEE